MKPLLVWYWRGHEATVNFGEHFCELLLTAFGYKIVAWEAERRAKRLGQHPACLMVIGSEFRRHLVNELLASVPEVHIWGQGNGRGPRVAVDMTRSPYRERVKIFALRGPLTKQWSHVTQDIPLCDPGFLLPRFYPLTPTGTGGVLYVPHCANRANAATRLASLGADRWVDVMFRRSQLQDVMRDLAAASFVLTNTLHTFIFCLAYRIPCAVSLVDGEALNMPDKWKDVFLSMNAPDAFQPVTNVAAGRDWWEQTGQHLQLPATEPLLAAFPYPILKGGG